MADRLQQGMEAVDRATLPQLRRLGEPRCPLRSRPAPPRGPRRTGRPRTPDRHPTHRWPRGPMSPVRSRKVSGVTMSGSGAVESPWGNGLRAPNQNGSSMDGGSNVPETVSSRRGTVGADERHRVAGVQSERLGGRDGEGDLSLRGRRPLDEGEVIACALPEHERSRSRVVVHPDGGPTLRDQAIAGERRRRLIDRCARGPPVEARLGEDLVPDVAHRDRRGREGRREDRLAPACA